MDSRHWFIYTFMYINENYKIVTNFTMGYSSKRINKADIAEAKSLAHAPENAVVMNISYLGYMTQEEFEE
jgi:hypothetical protein